MNNIEEIKLKIAEYQKIIIHRHQNPDPDAIGSQNGLAEAIRETFPGKDVYAIGDDVGDLNWIAHMDEIDDDMYNGALVIVVDTANQPRVSDKRYTTGDYLIKIDHHPADDNYGDLQYVDTTASSSSEIIYDLMVNFEFKINLKAANSLYAGIVGDTGRFMYASTTAHTFWVASQLRDFGVDTAAVNQKLSEVTLDRAKLQSGVYNDLQADENGAAWLVISKEKLKELDVTASEAHGVVSLPGRIKGIKTWVIAIEVENGYKIHYRSKGPIINDLAKKHNGGGHPLASGASAKDKDEVNEIIKEVQEKVK